VGGGVLVVVLLLRPPSSTTQAAINTRASHPSDLMPPGYGQSYDLNE